MHLQFLGMFLSHQRSISCCFINSFRNHSYKYCKSVFSRKRLDAKLFYSVKRKDTLMCRNLSQKSENNRDEHKPPTALMTFTPTIRPEFFMTIKNWVLAKFIIQPYLDNDFTLKDFTHGAKQALGVVSSYLSQGDFQSLSGLITEDAVAEIKRNFSSLTVKERKDLLIKVTDILFAFPYQIGIIFDDSSEKRFAEITVIYHCINDFEELREQGKISPETAKNDIKICNYRFIREYTKGVVSDWTINRLGHYKLSDFEA